MKSRGRSKRRIARELGLDRLTVRRYLAAAGAKSPGVQTGSARARRGGAALVREGLKRTGLREAELAHLPGSDPRKVKISRLVWEQTAVPQIWIAERRQMASASNVSQQLRRQREVNRC